MTKKTKNVYEMVDDINEMSKEIIDAIKEHLRKQGHRSDRELEALSLVLQSSKESMQLCRDYVDLLLKTKPDNKEGKDA